jgi:hypothetical protein|tara:strand:+ start:421 stop:894 length:474 start_codon:yes stop_codon:yes gene_type:complete
MSESDDIAEDILGQLTNMGAVTTQTETAPEEDIDIDNLEDFLIKNSGALIKKTIKLVDNVSDYIGSAPQDSDVSALADLIRASTGSIEVLNKLHIAKERNKSQSELKDKDIASRERISEGDNETKQLLSRDEILKAIVHATDDEELPKVDGTVVDID